MMDAMNVDTMNAAMTDAPGNEPPGTGRPSQPLLSVQDLRVHFPTSSRRGAPVVKAVDGISFEVRRNTIVGLVGESGSGKTTTGRALLRLLPATGGRIVFDGADLEKLDESAMLPWRRRMQIVFQDPYASLNPRMTVAEILDEALDTHKLARERRGERIAELLTRVGLNADHARRYPHEFSGGQRQRIGIARALAVEPEFIVADEPVSALDVSVQAQVLNLLQDLQRDLGLAMLFVAHDLAVVNYLCDEVVVLYLGRVMESGPTRRVYASPRHPYTRALLSAAPVPDPRAPRNRILLKGDIPSPLDPPSGCVFRTRCPHAIEACAGTVPQPEPVGAGHMVACLRAAELA
jgi:peptide/nickel transport system ATP-binding protein